MSALKKRFNLKWMFEAPEAVLTCSILKCGEKRFFVFGGHDRALYLMDNEMQILDQMEFGVDVSLATEAIPPNGEELRILREKCDPQRLILG